MPIKDPSDGSDWNPEVIESDGTRWTPSEVIEIDSNGNYTTIFTDEVIFESFEGSTWPSAWNIQSDTNDFTQTTTNALHETYSIENDPNVFEGAFSAEGAGLDTYPSYPCKIVAYYIHQNSPNNNRFSFGVGNDNDGDGDMDEGLRASINGSDHKTYLQEDTGTGWTQIGSAPYSSTGTTNQWYASVVYVDDGTFLNSGSYTLGHELHEYDPSTGSFTELGSQQATFDSTLQQATFGLYFAVGKGYSLSNFDKLQDLTNE